MSPHSPSLVARYVTKIELGQIGATLVLPVSLHSDKFVAAGEKLVRRMRNWSVTISTSSQPGGFWSSFSLKTNIGSGCGQTLFLQSSKYREKNVESYLLTLSETYDCWCWLLYCSVQCMLCSDAESSLFLPQTFQPWKYSNLDGGYLSAQICRIVTVSQCHSVKDSSVSWKTIRGAD